uniref:RING-type domain-containing protein n=1 Tax=viral metagenome TaxID=1070528 RepID=A0A6C0AW43_9ZZZZ|tara:strand:- start:99 stop:533 length:435 start_codon:yes stop_codon:yes gene_type:complete
MNNDNNLPSAPNYEDVINNNKEDNYIDELSQLPDFSSTMNLRLNRTIDFLTEENKYFRDKINCLDDLLKQLKYQIISYKQMLLDKNVDKKDSVYCILCMDNNRNVLFKPCNHIVICDKCSGSTDLKECIICKSHIESYEYAYLV